MNEICSNGLLLFWPVAAGIAGFYAIAQSVMAWRNPDALFTRFRTAWYPPESKAKRWQRVFGWTRERRERNVLFQARFLAPVIGPTFIAVSLWMLTSAVHCPSETWTPQHIVSLFLPLMFRPFSDGYAAFAYIWIAFGTAFAIAIARRLRLPYNVLSVLLLAATMIAWSEGAEYHVGVQANRWGSISVVPFLLYLITSYFGRKSKALSSGQESARL